MKKTLMGKNLLLLSCVLCGCGGCVRPPAEPPAAPEAPAAAEWVQIQGGKFLMGGGRGEKGFENAGPMREVSVKTFEMSRTHVTVAQYAQCVTAGDCSEPGSDDYCNWGAEGRQDHPVNCVDWRQAAAYAAFRGAKLPSEAQWEYAARGQGRVQDYPWGGEAPDCGRVVMSAGGYGCGSGGTSPVCSKPAGNTAQGLCDMAGNVWQWVRDSYSDSYSGAPSDGGAFKGEGFVQVLRGGAFNLGDAAPFKVYYRNGSGRGDRYAYIGFRLAREPR